MERYGPEGVINWALNPLNEIKEITMMKASNSAIEKKEDSAEKQKDGKPLNFSEEPRKASEKVHEKTQEELDEELLDEEELQKSFDIAVWSAHRQYRLL